MKQKTRGTNVATTHGLMVLSVALGLSLLNTRLCLGATVTFSNNVAAAQSSTDAIAGMYPYLDLTQYDYYASLTDGLMRNNTFAYYDRQLIYAYGMPDTDEYVSQVDVWVYAEERGRAGIDVDIAFSRDGVSFTHVITEKYAPVVTGTNWNLGRFQFEPEETRGMSHIRIISRNYPSAPRIGEIDVFTVPERPNYKRSFSVGIPLNQSATDDINGLLPTVLGGGFYVVGGNAALTDAESATSPTTRAYCDGAYNVVTSRWDLALVVKANTFLDCVDFWMEATDGYRVPTRFGIAVSADGSTWRQVADTGYRASQTNYNLVRIDFDHGAITDFRYVGIIDYPGINAGRHCSINEIDVFTIDVPRGTVLAIR